VNKRGSLGWRRTTVLALGAITVLAVLSVDPAAAALLLDTDFLVLAGTAGLALAGADLRTLAHRLATSRAVVLCRAGVTVSRDRPRSLIR
jgi:peptidoglycan/LPS O-acetylase OafA/YrhL